MPLVCDCQSGYLWLIVYKSHCNMVSYTAHSNAKTIKYSSFFKNLFTNQINQISKTNLDLFVNRI